MAGQVNAVLADAHIAAALRNIVPVAGRLLLGSATESQPDGEFVEDESPLLVAGDLPEPLIQAGRPYRPVTPAQIEAILAASGHMEDGASSVALRRHGVEILRTG